MERFTRKNENGEKEICFSVSGSVADRLYDYEETGLTPDEVKELAAKSKTENSEKPRAFIYVKLDNDCVNSVSISGKPEEISAMLADVIHNGISKKNPLMVSAFLNSLVRNLNYMVHDDMKNFPQKSSEALSELLRKIMEGDKNAE